MIIVINNLTFKDFLMWYLKTIKCAMGCLKDKWTLDRRANQHTVGFCFTSKSV